jgi:hypothetical protein
LESSGRPPTKQTPLGKCIQLSALTGE